MGLALEICDKPTAAQRVTAMRIYQRAVRRGELVRATTCAWCAAENVPTDGHHPDYNRPLMVVWLCEPCHHAHHKAYRGERDIAKGLTSEIAV